MSYSEREAATGLITMIIVALMFVWRLSGQAAAGAFDGPDGLQIWARSVLMLVGISIGVAIVVNIAAHVLHGILTGGDRSDDRRDERDRQIERSALQWAWHILSFSLLGVIVDLALGASALRAMTLVMIACAGSEMFKDAFKILCYRRGA